MRVCYGCGSTQTYVRNYNSRLYSMWYLNHDDEDNVLCRKCYNTFIANPKRYNKQIKPYKLYLELNEYHRARQRLFDIVGRACVKCGNDDIRILQFDHINGGGNKEQKHHKSNLLMYIYYYKHPEEAKQKIQVMCPNCNALKRVELKEFPNQI